MSTRKKTSHIVLKCPGEPDRRVPKGYSGLDYLNQYTPEQVPSTLAVMVNHLPVSLNTPFQTSSEIRFVHFGSREGNEVFRRGFSFLLFCLIRKLSVDACILVEHSLNRGLYCEFRNIPAGLRGAVAWLRGQVAHAVAKDDPFKRVDVSPEKVRDIFLRQGQENTAELMGYMTGGGRIPLYRYRGVYGYFLGPLPPSTAYLNDFELESYPPGFIFRYKPRTRRKPGFQPWNQRNLFRVYNEHERWAKILGVENIASLNRVIESGEISEFIKLAEALHEKKIIHVADHITEKVRERNAPSQLILISGPSSSGKTTFSKRLSIQLRVNGLTPLALSLDNYFVDRELTPKTPEGEYDFEALEALDLELFNDHLDRILRGETVRIPEYDFHTGKRSFRDHYVQAKANQPVLIEGIHALNDRLSREISATMKVKIYISALTTLNVDNHNRILTSDNRLIRRIIRDKKYRGYTARQTIARWPQVRSGENQHIFTFQEEAEIVFNSALIYELAVFKPLVMPLLEEIPRGCEGWGVACRLLQLFSLIRDVSVEEIPPTSVLREFIGGSSFHY